jgi:hypothetical protein
MLSRLDSPLLELAVGFLPAGRFAGGTGGVGLDPVGRAADPLIPLGAGATGIGRDVTGGGGGGGGGA